MRVLHVVKTSDGAIWAARQARVLRQLGVEVHVALPSPCGKAVSAWVDAGAEIHIVNLNLPVKLPHRIPAVLEAARRLVSLVGPEVIHSHFVTTTCVLRLALGKSHKIPRVYQVAGPLHLEHWPSRAFEISLAGGSDYWIGSSRCINEMYKRRKIPPERLYLSYYGWFSSEEEPRLPWGRLRSRINASNGEIIIGNVNFMYPPKLFLGHTAGVKCHEDVIDALGEVIQQRKDVLGLIVGGPWGDAEWYEKKLRKRAWNLAGDRIRFTGELPFDEARHVWVDFNLAIHVPLSENCGGVPEPLWHGVPVIASNVGGIPEIIIDGKTGWLVPVRQPLFLANKIFYALNHLDDGRKMASVGRQLVRTMLDTERTGHEVHEIYQHILGFSEQPPPQFDSEKFVDYWNPQNRERTTPA